MRDLPESIQLVNHWQSNLPIQERKMTVLASFSEQWMQLERDKQQLRKMTNNQIRQMTEWQKSIEKAASRGLAELEAIAEVQE